MTTSLVSVVLPTHNRQDDLARAVRSVLAQDYDRLELIVVDDASTDATPDVLDGFAGDRRLRVVRNDEPLGPSRARNRGLEVAEGEFLSFCDDDDTWLPGAARYLVDALEEEVELGGVSSWYEVVDASSGGRVTFRGPGTFDARQLLWQNLALVFGMFRRSAFTEEPRFDPALITGEDWDLWLRLARRSPVRSIPRTLYSYRQHASVRVTRSSDRAAQGRRGFLAKHGAEMTGACRLYHETVVAGYEHGRAGMVRRLDEARDGSWRDPAFVALVLGVSVAAIRVGARRGDPGLQARLMAKLAARDGRRPCLRAANPQF